MGTCIHTLKLKTKINTPLSQTMSVHEILANTQLIKKDKTTVAGSDALAGKKKVLVYFSAHWCPPCRMFTPMLNEAFSYFSNDHGDWLLVPHGSQAGNELKKLCSVTGIPMLVMFNADGSLNTKEARNLIASGALDKITK